ncbi:ABC transporter ATP-binding protein [Tessaracoccus lacteus]|uniref:ABC transporter ATP-binding protein n=1 Tax=Tessaracoccus lacteus TaxID=3041766 RepID=A0ABY8PYB1_9ACTN|nr:ABC transporter ATP-binding protein [Tessaracoccus sp. T21]WGT47450.1 ABC transporter ATP-binding protein [Tessaracoccus sp. T21]
MSIDVADLTISLATSGRPLVEGLSFTLAPGERLGIIGESGSGKSVTIFSLLGLLPRGLVAGGSVEISGTQVVGARPAELRALRGAQAAIVFQEPATALDPLTRVGDLIAEPLARHRGLRGAELDEAVRAALREVSLPDDRRTVRSFPHEISGGQRQRVAIAMALACQPRFLLADEPTTALDVTVQAEILDLIRRLCDERGMGLIFVSHDLAVVAGIVDRALVMQHGHVVEEGPIVDLVNRPQHPYTASLVASARALEQALATGELP